MIETGIIIAAIVLGATHSIAPDHWAPFVAVSKAERWSLSKSIFVSLVGGLGHITTSILLGVGVILVGLSVSHHFENFENIFSGSLLLVFGLLYTIISMHTRHSHEHHQEHILSCSLVLIASVSPCVPFIPVMLASVPYGGITMVLTLIGFILSTLFVIGTLVLLSLKSLEYFSPTTEKRLNVVAGLVLVVIGAGVLTGLF